MSDNIFMKKFSEDEVVIREGETYEEMYKIVSGRAALYLQYGTENEYLIGVLSDGKCFGEVSVLTGKPSPYSVVAISDIMVMRIGADRFESFISQNPRNTAEIMKNKANKELAESIRMKLAQYNLSGISGSSVFSEKA